MLQNAQDKNCTVSHQIVVAVAFLTFPSLSSSNRVSIISSKDLIADKLSIGALDGGAALLATGSSPIVGG